MVVEALDVGRFAAALRACRGVVGTAGSNLIAEAGALGRPVLALAPSHMIEQQVNARLAENDGFAIAAAAEEVDVPAIERFEALLARGVPKIELQTPTVTEALLACLAELERPV
jgi:UDP-N-acetylglucosamine:LPS N-acetylglucosamine transferase